MTNGKKFVPYNQRRVADRVASPVATTNIPNVKVSDLTKIAGAPYERCFTTEASSLGWKPGEWPLTVNLCISHEFPPERLNRESLTAEHGACYANIGRTVLVQVFND